jgi:multicomponent Na+:H+ antiporter subunit D
VINLPPALILILGSLLIPFLKGRVKSVYLVALPILGFLNILGMTEGTYWTVEFLDFELVFGRIDRFTLIFGNISDFPGFGIKSAFPFLHGWLIDAYPESTPTGTVFSAPSPPRWRSTPGARLPGTELLIYIGALMTCFPIFYAVIENDLRRVLAYSLINQLGFMVVGIGIGTELALNGAVAHAFNDVIFKGLLMMSMGAVLHVTGEIRGSELGGLYKKMPKTAILCMVGAASISAFPLFSGFVSKSMVVTAAIGGPLVRLAGVAVRIRRRVPPRGHQDPVLRLLRARLEAPSNMLIAMGIAAFMCVFLAFPIGGYKVLYNMLPFATEYQPYTFAHVNGQFLVLFFSALAFTLLLRAGLYPAEKRSVNLDSDWLYRKGGVLFYNVMARSLNGINTWTRKIVVDGFVARLAANARIGPARIAAHFMVLYWLICGKTGDEIHERRTEFLRAAEKSIFPIGLTAVLAVLLMGILISL